MGKIPEVALDVGVELPPSARLEEHGEGCVRLRTLLKLAEHPHLNGLAPVLADNHALKVHEKNLHREEIMMVRKSAVGRKRVGGSRDGVLRL